MKTLKLNGLGVRIDDLELRCNTRLGKNPDTLEIVKWNKTERANISNSYTICIFEPTMSEEWDLRFVGDRILGTDIDIEVLLSLIKIGFTILNEVEDIC